MGVSYLLDTHALVWMLDGRVPERVREAVTDVDVRVLVSSVSAFELATKLRIGRFDAARDLVENFHDRVHEFGAALVDLSTRHAVAAGSLEWDHRDPFDRLLVAQARCDNLTLVTADRAVLTAPGVRLLEW